MRSGRAYWRWGVALLAVGTLALLNPVTAGAHEPGRMTGGGNLFTRDGVKVTHGFEIYCIDPEGSPPIEPNNLQVNWAGNRFHLEELLTGECVDDPTLDPGQPRALFDSYKGTGTGRCNGQPGATIAWKFTDNGEPGGGRDFARFDISCPSGLTLFVERHLNKGNHQAHLNRR